MTIAALVLVAAGCIGLRLIGTGRLGAFADSLATDGSARNVDRATLTAIIQNALWLGVGYLLIAGGALLGRRRLADAIRRTLGDLGVSGWRLRRQAMLACRAEPWAVALVSTMTLLFGGLTLAWLGQPIRTDEATSYLNYATRNPLIPLAVYQSTNNHMLHSLLLWASVQLFGHEEWAIRIPAWTAGLSLPLLVYLAGRAWLGVATASAAIAMFVGSAYAVDFATNARGYTILAAMMLLQMSLIPRLERGSPSAWFGFALTAAVGLWAVPIMLFPLAMLIPTLAVRAVGRREMRRPMVGGLALAGLLTIAAYTPAMMTSGIDNVSRPQAVRDNASTGPLDSLEDAAQSLEQAAGYWTYGWPSWLATAAWAAAGLAVVGLLIRGGRGRSLMIGLLVGPTLLVLAVSAKPPPWTWFWAFPIGALLLAAPLSWAIPAPRRSGGGSMAIAGAALAIALLTAGPIWAGAYDQRAIPWNVGYPDAASAAARVADLREPGVGLAGPPILQSPIRYYLTRHGVSHDESATAVLDLTALRGERNQPWPQTVILVGRAGQHLLPRIENAMQRRYTAQRRIELNNSFLTIYQLDQPMPSPAQGVEPD